jgi:diaminobutyrate-2-oxoglutarate transaminase
MLNHYWTDSTLEKNTEQFGHTVRTALEGMSTSFGAGRFSVRGNGLLCGLDIGDTELAAAISRNAFERRLIVETCGPGDTIVKLLTPLVIEPEQLDDGLGRLALAVEQATTAR